MSARAAASTGEADQRPEQRIARGLGVRHQPEDIAGLVRGAGDPADENRRKLGTKTAHIRHTLCATLPAMQTISTPWGKAEAVEQVNVAQRAGEPVVNGTTIGRELSPEHQLIIDRARAEQLRRLEERRKRGT